MQKVIAIIYSVQWPLFFNQDFDVRNIYFVTGGLPYDLTEGDILCVFSQ